MVAKFPGGGCRIDEKLKAAGRSEAKKKRKLGKNSVRSDRFRTRHVRRIDHRQTTTVGAARSTAGTVRRHRQGDSFFFFYKRTQIVVAKKEPSPTSLICMSVSLRTVRWWRLVDALLCDVKNPENETLSSASSIRQCCCQSESHLW